MTSRDVLRRLVAPLLVPSIPWAASSGFEATRPLLDEAMALGVGGLLLEGGEQGAVRALVLLGAIHLVVVAAMPGERTPSWLTDAAVRPLSAGSARVIQIILPGLGRGADALTPRVSSSVSRGFSDDEALPPTQSPPNSPATAP